MLTETRVIRRARDLRLNVRCFDQSQSDGTTCVGFACLERWNEALLYFLIHIEKEWCERVYARCPFHSCESSCVRVYICRVQNNLIISIRFFFFASLSHVRWYVRVQLAATINVALMFNLFMFHCRSFSLSRSRLLIFLLNEWMHLDLTTRKVTKDAFCLRLAMLSSPLDKKVPRLTQPYVTNLPVHPKRHHEPSSLRIHWKSLPSASIVLREITVCIDVAYIHRHWVEMHGDTDALASCWTLNFIKEHFGSKNGRRSSSCMLILSLTFKWWSSKSIMGLFAFSTSATSC